MAWAFFVCCFPDGRTRSEWCTSWMEHLLKPLQIELISPSKHATMHVILILWYTTRIPPTEEGGKATNVLRQEPEGEVTQGDAVSTVVTESSLRSPDSEVCLSRGDFCLGSNHHLNS
jgi:hypothetical protein